MTATNPALHALWLDDPACAEVSRTGGKAANLARLAARHRVPPGFCLPAEAYDADATGPSEALLTAIQAGYARLAALTGEAEPAVAVRSSAIDEDGGTASFAGQHETLLNVRGAEAIAEAVVRCWRSLRTERALEYRLAHGLEMEGACLAVLVQALVPADAAGVVFSANPVNGSRDEAVLNASFGLGEAIVSGTVTPDTYIVRKDTLEITTFVPGYKEVMTVLSPAGELGTAEEEVPEERRELPAITDEQARDAVRLAVTLEREMGWPADVECAWKDGVLYLLQCRPITTLS